MSCDRNAMLQKRADMAQSIMPCPRVGVIQVFARNLPLYHFLIAASFFFALSDRLVKAFAFDPATRIRCYLFDVVAEFDALLLDFMASFLTALRRKPERRRRADQAADQPADQERP